MAVSATSSSTDTALTSDQMLARAKASTAASGGSGNKSAVQKLLDAHPAGDTVELSPVAKLLAAQQTSATKTKSFMDEDWYINAKVAQLKQQISLYSTLPDLDPSGGVMDSLTTQVNDLVGKQQAKLKASQAEAAAKQAELAKANDGKYNGVSSTDMLSRSKQLATTGKVADAPISAEAQAMLDKVSGKKVDTTA